MQTIYLLIGVPGSGKTWAAEQLKDSYDWVAHDDYEVGDYHLALLQLSRRGDKRILAEAPFRASVLKEQLERQGAKVVECYLTESLEVCRKRYEARDGKPYPRQHISNHARYVQRAAGSRIRGTSSEVLSILKQEKQ